MKIGIDGRPFLGKRTGVGRYVFELCKRLDELLPDAQFYVYAPIPVEMPVSSVRWTLRVSTPYLARLKPVLWLKIACGGLCRQDDLDVFWGSAVFLPRLQPKTRKVITIYDLTFKVAPGSMGFSHRVAYELFFSNALRSADAVMAISEGTSDRLQRWFGRKADCIVYPAVDARFRIVGEAERAARLDALGVRRPYLLTLATWEPRKNLESLVRAFLRLTAEKSIPQHSLLMVGGRGWKDAELVRVIATEGGGKIQPLGYLPDEDLAVIYSGADLFIFPSTYEGFGIPVAEALKCGARVLASDTPELREAGGALAHYVIPTPENLVVAILADLNSPRPDIAAHHFTDWRSEATKVREMLVGAPTPGPAA